MCRPSGEQVMRYVLSDDLGAEQRAFRLAFPGLIRGEIEVSEPDILPVSFIDNLISYPTTNNARLDNAPALPRLLYAHAKKEARH